MWCDTARLATSAPLQNLHYESLTPIIPAKFGSGKSLKDLTFGDAETHLVLPRIVDKVAATGEINLDILTQHFFELTRGSVSARIRDFIAEAQAAAEAGDQRAALTALAPTMASSSFQRRGCHSLQHLLVAASLNRKCDLGPHGNANNTETGSLLRVSNYLASPNILDANSIETGHSVPPCMRRAYDRLIETQL
jgi:hypothetical protein